MVESQHVVHEKNEKIITPSAPDELPWWPRYLDADSPGCREVQANRLIRPQVIFALGGHESQQADRSSSEYPHRNLAAAGPQWERIRRPGLWSLLGGRPLGGGSTDGRCRRGVRRE